MEKYEIFILNTIYDAVAVFHDQTAEVVDFFATPFRIRLSSISLAQIRLQFLYHGEIILDLQLISKV